MQLAALAGGAACPLVLAATLTGCGGTAAEPTHTAAPRGVAIVAAGRGDYTYRLRRWRLGSPHLSAPLSGTISADDPAPVAVGRTLHFTRGSRSFEVPLQTGRPRELRPPTAGVVSLAAPGGNRLASVSSTECVPPSDPAAGVRIYRLHPRTLERRVVPDASAGTTAVDVGLVGWSGDGSSLVFTVWRSGGDCPRGTSTIGVDLIVLDVRTGKTEKLDSGSAIVDATIDPAGRRLAYTREDDLDRDVRVATLATRRVRVLAHDTDVHAGPLSWSPDRVDARLRLRERHLLVHAVERAQAPDRRARPAGERPDDRRLLPRRAARCLGLDPVGLVVVPGHPPRCRRQRQ
jgi:hypothetical protein